MSRFVLLRLTLGVAILSLGVASISTFNSAALAAPAQAMTLGPSGLPLPRFVSLKAGRVNLRIGPGRNYSVDWLYLKPGLPMEVIQEYDNWRRVRDSEGTEGWINQSLLSGRRTAIAAPWQKGKDAVIPLRIKPDPTSPIAVSLEPGVIGMIKQCNGDWCEMKVGGHSGWIQQSQIWGAYPGEQVDD